HTIYKTRGGMLHDAIDGRIEKVWFELRDIC
ncbi:MAG: hypothetical protein ACI8PP_002734, partial [Candidatus Pseudothioglobus sp.]